MILHLKPCVSIYKTQSGVCGVFETKKPFFAADAIGSHLVLRFCNTRYFPFLLTGHCLSVNMKEVL